MKYKKEINQGFETSKDFSIKTIEKDGGLMPMIQFIRKDGKLGIVAIPELPENFAEKSQALRKVGEFISTKDKEIVAFTMASEAWMTTHKKEDVKPEDVGKKIPRPTDDPNRVEILMIAGQDISGNKKTYLSTFHRKDGKIKLKPGKEQAKMNKLDWSNTKESQLNLIEALIDGYNNSISFKKLI